VNLEKYQIESNEGFEIFDFYSHGPKGIIHKRVMYLPTSEPNLWQLIMGDYNPETDKLDVYNVTNNNDREKVLATVGATLFTFFNKHPKLMVYAKGSTEPRTRLYQMGINQLIDEIDPEFYVFGELDGEYERFNKNINYKSFIVIKKEK
jgi:hypothetical protein